MARCGRRRRPTTIEMCLRRRGYDPPGRGEAGSRVRTVQIATTRQQSETAHAARNVSGYDELIRLEGGAGGAGARGGVMLDPETNRGS